MYAHLFVRLYDSFVDNWAQMKFISLKLFNHETYLYFLTTQASLEGAVKQIVEELKSNIESEAYPEVEHRKIYEVWLIVGLLGTFYAIIINSGMDHFVSFFFKEFDGILQQILIEIFVDIFQEEHVYIFHHFGVIERVYQSKLDKCFNPFVLLLHLSFTIFFIYISIFNLDNVPWVPITLDIRWSCQSQFLLHIY